MDARFWEIVKGKDNKRFRCLLCFRKCILSPGEYGKCGVRYADQEKINSPYLGKFSSCAIESIIKKPISHWHYKSNILSLGSLSCTMNCPFCQNHQIAQPANIEKVFCSSLSPEELQNKTLNAGLHAIAFTYNEPTLQAEYIIEASKVFRKKKIDSVLISNGMFSQESLEELTECVAAANIDIKTFNSHTYSSMGGSLETVMHNVEYMVKNGVHIELTNLIVPGISDNVSEFREMVNWISGISPDIPLHITRYFPAYKYHEAATDIWLLNRFIGIAKEKLKCVHGGNF